MCGFINCSLVFILHDQNVLQYMIANEMKSKVQAQATHLKTHLTKRPKCQQHHRDQGQAIKAPTD